MVAEITNELIYEVLKSVQAQVAIIREDMESLKTRLTTQDGRLSQMLSAIAGLHGDLAEVLGPDGPSRKPDEPGGKKA